MVCSHVYRLHTLLLIMGHIMANLDYLQIISSLNATRSVPKSGTIGSARYPRLGTLHVNTAPDYSQGTIAALPLSSKNCYQIAHSYPAAGLGPPHIS